MYNNRRNNPRYSFEDGSAERRRLEALARSMCLHRYFDNESPQRMQMCRRQTGHEGPCGQKELKS